MRQLRIERAETQTTLCELRQVLAEADRTQPLDLPKLPRSRELN
jgi:hypothetical protein